MKLRITRKAARYCKRYLDTKCCLAATAARFQFPRIKNIRAFGSVIIIGRTQYLMPEYFRIFHAYDSDWQKIRPDFKPFILELTRV